MLTLFFTCICALMINPVNEEMTVTARQVRVAVFDKQGHSVTGLEKEDFQLVVNGDPVSDFIFQEMDFSKPDKKVEKDQEQPGRRLVFLLKTGINRKEGIDALKNAVRQSIDSLNNNDMAMLIQIGSDIRVLRDFTADKQSLRDALADLEDSGREGNLARVQDKANLGISRFYMDIITGNIGNPSLLQSVDPTNVDYNSSRALFKLMYKLSYFLSEFEEEKAIYLFSGGYGMSPNSGATHLMRQVIQHMNTMGISIHQLTYLGETKTRWATAGPSFAAIQSGGTYELMDNLQGESQGRIFAEKAGRYYLLTYTGDNADGLDKVRVRFTKRDHRLDYHMAYPRKLRHETSLDAALPEMADIRFYGLLAGKRQMNDLGMDWFTRTFKSEDGQFHTGIWSRVPIPQEPAPEALFAAVTLLDENRQVLQFNQGPIAVTPGKLFHFYDHLATARKPAVVRICLSLENGGEMSVLEQPLFFQESPFRISKPLLFHKEAPNFVYPSATGNAEAKRLDPFTYDQKEHRAAIIQASRPGALLYAGFNVAGTTNDGKALKTEVYLVSKGKAFQVPTRVLRLEKSADTSLKWLTALDTSQLQNGDYKFLVRLKDEAGRIVAETTTDWRFPDDAG